MRTISESKVLAVPGLPVNPELPSSVNNAVVAQLADNAATNSITKNSALQGAATVTTATGKEAVIGSFALTPEQLSTVPNGLKPGMDKVVQRQIAAGVPLSQACPPAMWKQGDLQSFVKSPAAQATAQQSVVTTAAATVSTAIPGALKNPSAAAGLLVAASSMGKSALSSLKSNPMAALGMITKFGSSIKSMINIGNTSASPANLKMPDVKSMVSNAFGALKSKASSLTASLTSPQNLAAKAASSMSDEAKKALPLGAIPAVPTASDLSSKFSQMTDSLKEKAAGKLKAIGDSATAAMTKIGDQVSSLKNTASSLASKISSGFSKPPEIKAPDVSADVKKLAGELSSGGDARVPKLP